MLNEKDQAIVKIKSTFLGNFILLSLIEKVEELQKEVESMKRKQSEKSSSYKKLKHDYGKLKEKMKREEAALAQFIKRFENDLAFARNSILSFERDLSNVGSLDSECQDERVNEHIGNSITYTRNMKSFINQTEDATNELRKIFYE